MNDFPKPTVGSPSYFISQSRVKSKLLVRDVSLCTAYYRAFYHFASNGCCQTQYAYTSY